MNFLNPAQIREWYGRSLQRSGLEELDTQPVHCWKRVVLQGRRALPPGFLANLLERLSHKSVGRRSRVPKSPVEEELLDKICIGTGFEHLEGVFILAGTKADPAFFSGVVEQIVDRIPGFHHEAVNFSDSDLDRSLQIGLAPDPAFNADEVLDSVYRDTLEALQREPFRLQSTDLFEIAHPDLFPKPANRTFYRVMMSFVAGITTWASGVFTLREEAPMVVSRFGEPQMLPLGGYDALTNKGDISSLVPSELAYIDESMEVDMFDYKVLENQLMYFKREQGAVFRIRRLLFVRLDLTMFMEHEKHLGMLFAWCLVLSEKLIETFCKDIIRIRFQFLGFKPSTLVDACEFFRLLLHEKGNGERVTVESHFDKTPLPEASVRDQCWVLGRSALPDMKFIPLAFPQTDEFAAQSTTEQGMTLGQLISSTIERMVGDAHR